MNKVDHMPRHRRIVRLSPDQSRILKDCQVFAREIAPCYERRARQAIGGCGVRLPKAGRSALIGVPSARAWLAIGASLVEPAAAYEAARRGIEELGAEYRGIPGPRHIMDDTGHSILLAKMAVEQGDHADAAERMTTVLRWRVAAYVRGFKGAIE